MTIYNLLAFFGALLINFLLDSSVFLQTHLFGLHPDSIIAVIVSISLVSGSRWGALYGLAAGLMMDTLFSNYLGFYTLGYILCGLLIGLFSRQFYAHNPFFCFGSAFLMYLLQQGCYKIQMIIIGQTTVLGGFWRYFALSGVITAALTIPVYYLYRKSARFELRRARWEIYSNRGTDDE